MNGKEGNNRRRRPFKKDSRRGQGQNRADYGQNPRENQEGGGPARAGSRNSRFSGEKSRRRSREKRPAEKTVRRGKNGELYNRPQWAAPKQNSDPLPVLECIRCGKTITDLHSALKDRKTGAAAHFDCVMAEVLEQETLEEGDTLSYIGGGRFGIVRFNRSGGKGTSCFTIKKIVEWEDKDNRADWRGLVADHYSIT
jgi:hypothetical protein